MNKCMLEITKDGFLLDNKPFYMASGDIHYFRIFKEQWQNRLQLMKDFGLSAVQVYVPWNMHEPEKGEFHFDGNLDIKAFLTLCDEIGLKVLFRPSPYICSEIDWGGLPYWLLKEPDLCIRTSDERFMTHVKDYYQRLVPEFLPFLSTKGGPIIAVAIENEYGSFANDREYIKSLGDILTGLGVDVPLYTCNGWEPFKLHDGSNKNYLNCLDAHFLTEQAQESFKDYQPDKPIFITEFWAGRGERWGEHFLRQDALSVAENYRSILEKGAYVNFYMFCGGTNFEFRTGSLIIKHSDDGKYQQTSFVTSYDVDAPVNEYGQPTEKYFACKKVLAEYKKTNGFEDTSSPKTIDDYKTKTQSIGNVILTKSADLLDNIDNISDKIMQSPFPKTFEQMDQAYGFMLYSTFVNYTDDKTRILKFEGLHDRAIVFADGKYIGTAMRREDNPEPITFQIPKEGMKLDILVENLGRLNNGRFMLNERKGILGCVYFDIIWNEEGMIYPPNWKFVSGWKNASLSLKDISKLDYNMPAKENRPAFFTGEFEATPGVDTFVNAQGWNKGVIWINGFNIGRYWKIGPQGTLYVPGELLKKKNTITLLELHSANEDKSIRFDNIPSLDTIPKTNYIESYANAQ